MELCPTFQTCPGTKTMTVWFFSRTVFADKVKGWRSSGFREDSTSGGSCPEVQGHPRDTYRGKGRMTLYRQGLE